MYNVEIVNVRTKKSDRITLPTYTSTLQEFVDEITNNSEDDYKFYIVDNYTSIHNKSMTILEDNFTLFDLNDFLNSFHEDDIEKILAIYDVSGNTLDTCISIVKNNEYECYPDCRSYSNLAETLVECGHYGNVDWRLRDYIDYNALGDDLEKNGYLVADDFNLGFYIY